MRTMKDSPLDLYSVIQGKKEVIKEILKLEAKGYSEKQIITHLKTVYSK